MPDQPISAEAAVATYFQPPQGSFWRWAEDHEVIEWANGTTITYRTELAALLAGLAPTGLPPLGPVLLLLAACNDAWQNSTAEIGLLQGLLRGLPTGGPPNEELTFHLSVARSFLDIVRQLPPTLRQGIAKEHLLREVLGSSDATHLLPAQLARPLAASLRADATDKPSFAAWPPFSRLRARRDLLAFDQAARRFPTVHSLELRLRTGLDQLPAPLAEDLPPPPPAPAPLPADLLAELAQDTQTAGLARLVPHLRATLHLPQPARQAGHQPLGGVADLTNRGPLDRLLLSELAQDDLSLLARLAHGEALYLRREAPPLPQPPPRVLLLDTTLQMWGLPRVAGLAAALALALPAARASQPLALAFALGGLTAQPLDLRTRPGVIAALSYLDPALHCGAALPALLPTLPAQAEAVLITEAQAARQPAFLAQLREAPPALRFLLTVARGGELALHELAGGLRTLLSTSQVDWEKVLFAPQGEEAREVQPTGEIRLPAFMRQKAPLLFPTLHVVPAVATMLYSEQLGALGLDKNRRLLYWEKRTLGARELLPLVEEGEYCIGFNTASADIAYLLVSQLAAGRQPVLILYKLNLLLAEAHRTDLSAEVAPHFNWMNTLYSEGSFILQKAADNLDLIIGCRKGTVRTRPHYGAPLPDYSLPTLPSHRFLNPGYSVLQRVNRIGISRSGLLTIENRQLFAGEYDFSLDTFTSDAIKYPATNAGSVAHLTANAGLRCQRFVWPNGSEAIVDGRGLLHLRSANPALPEVTLVLAINVPTAAWASDGQLCGSPYFTGLSVAQASQTPGGATNALDFYEAYLQPFIDHLR